jgi:hypothetical protein
MSILQHVIGNPAQINNRDSLMFSIGENHHGKDRFHVTNHLRGRCSHATTCPTAPITKPYELGVVSMYTWTGTCLCVR